MSCLCHREKFVMKWWICPSPMFMKLLMHKITTPLIWGPFVWCGPKKPAEFSDAISQQSRIWDWKLPSGTNLFVTNIDFWNKSQKAKSKVQVTFFFFGLELRFLGRELLRTLGNFPPNKSILDSCPRIPNSRSNGIRNNALCQARCEPPFPIPSVPFPKLLRSSEAAGLHHWGALPTGEGGFFLKDIRGKRFKPQTSSHRWWLNQPIWTILAKLDHFPNWESKN